MKGLILIPDISGFTNFVKSIDMEHGASITSDLLNSIIDNNPLDISLSEIEGDAILFYKLGKPLPLREVISGFKKMHEAFDACFRKWKSHYKIDVDLSLKLVVHYGDIIVYDIKGFKKLYGETVIESHNLLKNGNGIAEYILITEDYVKALQMNISGLLPHDAGYHFDLYEIYSGVKKIACYFFSSRRKASRLSNIVIKSKRILSDNMYLAVDSSAA